MNALALLEQGGRRRMLRQTVVNSRIVVVTSRKDNEHETSVMGGPLDGWMIVADDEFAALRNHAFVVKMVRSCA